MIKKRPFKALVQWVNTKVARQAPPPPTKKPDTYLGIDLGDSPPPRPKVTVQPSRDTGDRTSPEDAMTVQLISAGLSLEVYFDGEGFVLSCTPTARHRAPVVVEMSTEGNSLKPVTKVRIQ